MEKRVVLAELDYIFNVVKGSFNPRALARYLTAAGQWNKFIKDKAKSYGINVDPKEDFEKDVKNTIKKHVNKFDSELDLIQDWVMAYMFLPEALDQFDYTDEDGKDVWKSRGIRTFFEKFLDAGEKNKDKDVEQHFGKYVSKGIGSIVKNYIREERKHEDPFIESENENAIEREMNKEKKKVPKHKIKNVPPDQLHQTDHLKDKGGEIFGIAPGDMDRIQSIRDFRDDARYDELRKAMTSYVKKHGSPIVYKIMKLKIDDPDLKNKEIGDMVNKSEGMMSNYFKELGQVIMSFAKESENEDLVFWLKTLTTFFKDEKVVKEDPEEEKKRKEKERKERQEKDPQDAVKLEKEIEKQEKLIEDLEEQLKAEKDDKDKEGIKKRILEENREKAKLLNKRSSLKIGSIFDSLEALFETAPKKEARKIASIARYIDTLCSKLH